MEPLNNVNNNNMMMNSFDNFTTNNVVNEFIPLSNPNPNDTTTTTTFSCDALLHHHQRPLNINPFDETTSFINPDPPFYDPAAMLSHHHHHFLPTTTTFDQEPINTGLKPISEFGSSSLIKSSTPPSFRDNIDINNKSHRNHNNNNNNGGKKRKRKNENSKEVEKPREVVHVRARRGQATDSHSLAERLRREKINDKLRSLQDLVPGCYKTMGMAVMLDVIINYIRSLQNQIEFLSMKLSAASMFYDFNSSEFDAFETVQLGTSGYEAQVMERMVGDQGYGGFSHHFQSSTNWSL